jgi:hypothetical protein
LISVGSIPLGLTAGGFALSLFWTLITSTFTSSEPIQGVNHALLAVLISGLALLSIPVFTKAGEKAGTYIDERLNRPYGYYSILASLHALGVKHPVRYLEEHTESVEAYVRVLRVARFRIRLSNHMPAKDSPFRRWKPSEELLAEHRVAALVLPGPKEIQREQRIEHLVKERGIGTYDEIVGLLDYSDNNPLVLSDGAL